MDTNQDGRIDSDDLHNALAKVGAAIDEVEMQELFHASDIDGTGQIDYEEFIAAMLDSNRVAKRTEAVSECVECNQGSRFVHHVIQLLPFFLKGP